MADGMIYGMIYGDALVRDYAYVFSERWDGRGLSPVTHLILGW